MEWRPIPEWPDFAVSEFGDVMRVVKGNTNCSKAGRIARPRRERYMRVYLSGGGRQACWLVHRLVATVFIGPPPSPTHQAAHRDGNTYNNHFSNLYWATPSENAADKVRHGTIARGRRAGPDALTDRDVEIIRKLGQYSVSPILIAEIYHTSPTHVRRILAGEVWRSAA